MDSELIEAIKQLPPKQQTTAVAINHYLNKWQESENQVQKKIHTLQTEYLRSVLPLQKEINAIVKGLRAPTEEEIKDAESYAIETKSVQASPLQHYWGQVLINNSLTGKLLSEEDKEILKYLLSVEAELGENGKDFTLKFEFSDNEYFDACILAKEYKFENEDDEEPSQLQGTKIDWKNGKNITKKIVKRKQKNKKTGQVREIESEEKAPTFFHFFEDVNVIKDEVEQDERKQFDFELGSTFVNQIIPKALGNYLGLKLEDEDQDVDYGEDSEEEDGESLEDD